ncbi:Talin-1 [Liparis tanakae]|uniref:Talin-1 n=1 Tax=Liparis tanakae TaxID=230148 RepID=A0A4Z2E0V8_9TELE|nr:Talin-1 [Liparis tanakae]
MRLQNNGAWRCVQGVVSVSSDAVLWFQVGAIQANAVDDGQWSQGLISAARMVAAATNNLCEAANSAVQGHASEEKLISSAKQVAASTAQLLVACKVKADQDSQTMKRLQVSDPRLLHTRHRLSVTWSSLAPLEGKTCTD